MLAGVHERLLEGDVRRVGGAVPRLSRGDHRRDLDEVGARADDVQNAQGLSRRHGVLTAGGSAGRLHEAHTGQAAEVRVVGPHLCPVRLSGGVDDAVGARQRSALAQERGGGGKPDVERHDRAERHDGDGVGRRLLPALTAHHPRHLEHAHGGHEDLIRLRERRRIRRRQAGALDGLQPPARVDEDHSRSCSSRTAEVSMPG